MSGSANMIPQFDAAELAAASGAQQKALRPDTSVWVSASAGSGKTEILIRRLLALLLADVTLQPREILALTFTKAGAAEMAARLPRHLAKWSTLNNEELAATIEKDLALPVKDIAATAARVRALAAEVLMAPPMIVTIHALAQQLLLRFAEATDLPTDFTVLEQGEQERVLRDIQHHLLQRAQGPLADSLATLLDELGEHGWRDLTTLMVRDWRRLQEILGEGSAADILVRLDAALGLTGSEGWALGEIEILPAEMDALRAVAELLPEHEAAGVLHARGRITAWRNFLLTKDDGARARLFVKKDLAVVGEGVEEIFRTAQQRVVEQLRLRNVLRGRQLTEDLLIWGAAINTSYARRKQELGALDYADLLDALERLLQRADEGMAAWVWYVLDRKFKHLVLDEGQDNNPQQNRVTLWLARSLLSGDVGDGHPRTVMAVGDVKQSIFRFQGAVPSLFVELREALQLWSPERFAAVEVAHSFRSGKEVLAAVDSVFSDPEIARVVQGSEMDWLPHRAVATGRPSRVEVWPLVQPPEKEAKHEPWELPTVRFATQAVGADIMCFRELGAWLQARVSEGVVVPSTAVPLRYDDVMIVVQRNRIAALAAGVLGGMGVPVASAGVVPQPVRDVVALLRVLFEPTDTLALCAVLKAFCSLSDADLLALAARGWVLAEAEADFMRGFAGLSAMGVVQRAGRMLGGEQGMFDALLGWAEKANSLAELVARLEQEDLPAVPGNHGVRILTVHGSKGLEAPLVILPDTTGKMGDVSKEKMLWGEGTLLVKQGKGTSPFEDQLADAESARLYADSLRGLYVAMTRARDWLVVTGFTRNRNEERGTRNKDCWYNLVEGALGEGVRGEEFAVAEPAPAPKQPPAPAWLHENVALPLVNVAVE